MKELTVFNYNENEIRAIVKEDGQPWWVLSDMCKALDLGSPHKVSDRLDEDERNQIPVTDSLGRKQNTTIINEPGLYNVILRSDKPEAKEFKRWITHEVLPTLRREGTYSVTGKHPRVYPVKASSLGEVTNWAKLQHVVMKEQKSAAWKRAAAFEKTARQFGIDTIPDFIEPPEWESQQLSLLAAPTMMIGSVNTMLVGGSGQELEQK